MLRQVVAYMTAERWGREGGRREGGREGGDDGRMKPQEEMNERAREIHTHTE